ncbi:MAG TPA: sigma-70 family RNA polymerase sigma factor [Planctomycetota bacterium]|nr:sigma-70 family RNA polymerase sigma factor [Planctomycetota bacterium]
MTAAVTDDPRALVAQAQAGDERAFAELVRLYADRLFRFLSARGVGAEDARDLVQETFLRAWRALDRFDPKYAFSTWLYTIAHRLALNLRARESRRPHVPLAEDAVGAAAQPGEADDARPAGLWAVARENLAERDYHALWLYYAEEQDMRGVAQVLGVTSLHARVIVHRARARLAKLVTADGAAAGLAAGHAP